MDVLFRVHAENNGWSMQPPCLCLCLSGRPLSQTFDLIRSYAVVWRTAARHGTAQQNMDARKWDNWTQSTDICTYLLDTVHAAAMDLLDSRQAMLG